MGQPTKPSELNTFFVFDRNDCRCSFVIPKSRRVPATTGVDERQNAMKWGVIATGSICNDFTLALKKTPKAVLHACASRTQASADEFAQKHGFAKAYASYEALAADPEVEIVYIATPHAFHCDNILLCLEAGKHVLSEKPMVVNARQAQLCMAQPSRSRSPSRSPSPSPSPCRLAGGVVHG